MTTTDAVPDAPVRRLAIVGFGLIGASLAAALKAAEHAVEIVAVVRSESSARQALSLGFVDRAVVGTRAGVAGADLVMLCVPMRAMRQALTELAAARGDGTLPDRAIISDAGSVKGRFVEDARATLGSLARVVPGHPVAGREKSGMTAADPMLYRGRRVLLTPLPETDPQAVEAVSELWRAVGAEVECLSPARHDRVLAATSHLPHVIAFALVDALAKQQEAEEIFRYAAGGFRDFTRIAASDPIMWRDICLTNRDALLAAMDALEAHVTTLRTAIAEGDAQAIEATFERARTARQGFVG